nr:mitotic-spindle organizing protein 1A-like [Tanacetum cinerariifolium]GEX50999.1 mitotic-spindle organizing protein 1A-like [Tanacetum cinerariifolium]
MHAKHPEIWYCKFQVLFMDQDAARTSRESLELVFQMSNILGTGLDRHTLSVLIALCDLGLNPEALAAVVKEFRRNPPSTNSTPPTPSAS